MNQKSEDRKPIKSVTVYCSSSSGIRPEYLEAGREFGRELARNEISLIYGGATVGLMGAVADSVLENQGVVHGIIPHFLDTIEISHKGLHDLKVVGDMAERKRLLHEAGDAIVALPGGLGTLDEMVEVLVLKQLRLLNKPVFLLNIRGFWQPFKGLVEHMQNEVMVPYDNDLFDMCHGVGELMEGLVKGME